MHIAKLVSAREIREFRHFRVIYKPQYDVDMAAKVAGCGLFYFARLATAAPISAMS
jgi:hypothetical protein